MYHNYNPKELRTMSMEEAAYVSGFIDGEGSIFPIKEKRLDNRSGYRITVNMTVSQCHLGVLEAVREMTGCGTIVSEKTMQPQHKPRWKLMWNKRQMRHVIPQLLPYLIVKQEQAQISLQMLDLVKGSNNYGKYDIAEQQRLYLALRSLNKRGVDNYSKDTPIVREPKLRRPNTPTCSVDGCCNKHYGKGLCRNHYRHAYETVNRKKAPSYTHCVYCGNVLPQERRADSKYCTRECGNAYTYRSRKKQNRRGRVTPSLEL